MLEFETRQEFEKARIAIHTENPRICLMPIRYLGYCYKCPVFRTPKGKVCDSALIIKAEMQELENAENERVKLVERLKEIDAKLAKIKR